MIKHTIGPTSPSLSKTKQAANRLAARRVLGLALLLATSGCTTTRTNSLLASKAPTTQASVAANQSATAKSKAATGVNAALAAATQGSAGAHRRISAPDTSAPAATGRVVPVSYQDGGEHAVAEENSLANSSPLGDQVCATDQCISGVCATEACGCFPPIANVPQYWNDQEYLIDGGDREPKVELTEDWTVHGLDSQDTIAHYETIDGKLCVTPSNRVPIYAPRFGAVRKTSAPIQAARAVGAMRVVEPASPGIKSSNEPANNLAMPLGPQKRDAINPIDALRDRTRGVGAEKILPPIDLGSYQRALNRLQNEKSVVRREDLLAILGEYMVNARTWQSDEGIAVSMGGVKAVQVRQAKEVQDITVYKTDPSQCSLRICKAASDSAAHPGDIISFSIRFENIGNKPIGNLVILDSLVTRLEYIDGSQQCILSLASQKSPDKDKKPIKFSSAENEAGSTVLRWEAEEPLEAGDSGVITFRCRVR